MIVKGLGGFGGNPTFVVARTCMRMRFLYAIYYLIGGVYIGGNVLCSPALTPRPGRVLFLHINSLNCPSSLGLRPIFISWGLLESRWHYCLT